MLKLHQIIPMEVIRILAKHNFRLVGPWREFYPLKGNALLIKELPLRITFVRKNRDVIEELKPYCSRIVEGKNKVSMKIKADRHWIVLQFKE
ncbi:hypothetical protein [Pyrococcus kukulkanii]|uniref:Uncharacterized protein n=1 Tax=Pyrococcus kukulkanii TaxID=1609559 RepID=A0A127BBK6_9EURY|nr:hypothetical protein [Pyrococcus kukulkanii]AMM54036.1 hypothetical protein TQ32_05790 [Pyrococcus kukulkanii]